jgi:hypothetical protein
MPNQHGEHHLVTVWNPSYAADAMEQHLGLLLHLAGEYDKGAISDEQLYVWWGKVRSPNRQGPQANADDIRRIAKELDAGERDEVQLYLTDYQSLYVGDVDLIREGGPGDDESVHMPAYYVQERLAFDFSFRLRDIRRLVTRDMPEVIAELKELRNVHYNDRPVSLFGGMVDLPLIVTRPDGRRFFDDAERDALTGGDLWAEFDAEHASTVAVLERDLRLNLLGDVAWSRLEPEVRVFIAQAEKTFREHRDDPAFDFGPVIVGLGTALDRQTNATLAVALRSGVPVNARRVNLGGQTVDLLGFRALTLGELARVLGGEWQLGTALKDVVENAAWFTGSFPVMLDALAEVRNAAAHGKERIDRKRATEWRDRILGVGSIGEIVELAKVRVKALAGSVATVRARP